MNAIMIITSWKLKNDKFLRFSPKLIRKNHKILYLHETPALEAQRTTVDDDREPNSQTEIELRKEEAGAERQTLTPRDFRESDRVKQVMN